MSQVLDLLKELIAIPSITPQDLGCQILLSKRLTEKGFQCTSMPNGDISNLWAKRGEGNPLFVFAGHTDVVPPGPLEAWQSPPFVPTLRDGMLYGRGAADMKSGLAAMVIAAERFIEDYPSHKGSIGFLITSAEEGAESDEGTPFVLKALEKQNESIHFCIVGEASSNAQVGDAVKYGRRGSLTGTLKILGKQGHVAYPQLAHNPIHAAADAIAEIVHLKWDDGGEGFPATTLQISNIHGGTGAGNVIPGEMDVLFNLRYSPHSTPESIQTRIEDILRKYSFSYTLHWNLSGLPYLTTDKNFLKACEQAIYEVTGKTPRFNMEGGTSDGRYIAATGARVAEIGPVNESIHQVNECVNVKELEQLCDIYYHVLVNLLNEGYSS